MATPRRLELLTSGVTGRRSDQLNYGAIWLQMSGSNRRLGAYEARDLTVCPICSMLVGEAGIEPAYPDFQSGTHPSMSSSLIGTPSRIRTDDAGMKTLCLNRLTIGAYLVGQVGLEPTMVKPADLQSAAIATRRLTYIEIPPHIAGAVDM